MDSLAARCAWAISIIPKENTLDKGISDVDLAKVLGTDKNTIARYRRKEGLLKGEIIENLVKIYKFNPNWLLRGEGEPFRGAREKYPDVCGPEQPSFNENFVLIPQISGAISAGKGLYPKNEIEIMVAFRKDWIKRKELKEGFLSLIKVTGDSMEPTIYSGDLVLIDHSRTITSAQGGIYALAINDEIMIKRIQPLPEGKLRIISDNKKYPTIETTINNIMINGKVIWLGREI